MALSENYRTETIGRSDCRPIVRLSADTIVRWDYRPNPSSGAVVLIMFCLFLGPVAPSTSVKSSVNYTLRLFLNRRFTVYHIAPTQLAVS